MNNEINEHILEIMHNNNLSAEEKGKQIKSAYASYDEQVEKDMRNRLLKNWLGGAIEIGSSAIPVGGAAKAGASVGSKLFTKYLGKKLSQEIGSGALSGLSSGAVFGLGRGLIENENPLKTILQDGGTGLAAGSFLGGAGSFLERYLKGSKLKSYDTSHLPMINYRSYKNDAKNYYKDYLQGRVVNNDYIGDISLTRKGLDETISKNPELAKYFPDLAKNLKSADYLETNVLYKARKDNIKQFHTLKNDNTEYLIAGNPQGFQKFYLAKNKNTVKPGLPSREEGAGINSVNNNITNQGTPSREEGTSFSDAVGKNLVQAGLKPEGQNLPNNIVPNYSSNINPSYMAIPGAMLPLTNSGLISGGIEYNVDDLGNRIYTREDIGEMTSDEYSANEKSIMEQLNTYGIPTRGDMERAYLTGPDRVYVRPYTRSDGTEVRGYYRSK